MLTYGVPVDKRCELKNAHFFPTDEKAFEYGREIGLHRKVVPVNVPRPPSSRHVFRHLRPTNQGFAMKAEGVPSLPRFMRSTHTGDDVRRSVGVHFGIVLEPNLLVADSEQPQN